MPNLFLRSHSNTLDKGWRWVTQGIAPEGGRKALYGRLLTGAQWEKIRPLHPKRSPRASGGRHRARCCNVLEGIFWILHSGVRLQGLPEEFSSPATCWRRLRDWEEQGIWSRSGGRSWPN